MDDSFNEDVQEIKKKEPVNHAMQDIDYWKRKNVILISFSLNSYLSNKNPLFLIIP
jgi:hypothetical protein